MTQDASPRWFVLMAEDEDLACAVLEQRFLIDDFARLERAVGAAGHPEIGYRICDIALDRRQIENFIAALGADAAFLDFESVWLTDWSSLRDVPYLVHTNFELFLMLEGRKKLAQFADTAEWLEEHLAPFDRRVAEGRLIRRVIDEPVPAELRAMSLDRTPPAHVRRVLYALPGEEWRIDAFVLMWGIVGSSGWNETHERYEGMLYGYEDWQMNWWIDHVRRSLADRSES